MSDGEDPKWLLWCTQLKIEHSKIFEQLSTLSGATSQIGTLDTKVADLIASETSLQAENEILKDRIKKLEGDAKQHDQTNAASSQAFVGVQTEIDAFKERILLLEQDANQQDQINAVKSQANKTLEERFKILKSEHDSVIQAVDFMRRTALSEREGQKEELESMKVHMEAFMAGTSQRGNHATQEEFNDLTGLFPINPPRNRKTTSEATTADDSIQVDADKQNQVHNTAKDNTHVIDATQLHTHYHDSTQFGMNVPQLKITNQGSSSLEEYVHHSDTAITGGVHQFEAQAVFQFVNGLNDRYRQQMLKEALDKQGWTWQKAKQEMHRISKMAEKSRKRRRILPPDFGFSQQ